MYIGHEFITLPVTVNIRDGQNVTTIMEASRICHVAITSRIFNENLT